MNKYTAIQRLIQLDHDAAKAYESAISAVDNPSTCDQLAAFCADHHRHTENLAAILENLEAEVPQGPDLRRVLTQGRVVLADILGFEIDVLNALRDNAAMIHEAYDEALKLDDLDAAMSQTLKSNRETLRSHSEWLAKRCNSILAATATPIQS
ncbi:MAG: PA2169 family four-helix-bundle protein [Gammaproteobacteria bacterium]|nr:PA2169 family four-helix-bundle protein [Gammaproteobacteria bacterium]NND61400.1 DUF2383 domain-containing protein [Gammaproteobacteria bacterium]